MKAEDIKLTKITSNGKAVLVAYIEANPLLSDLQPELEALLLEIGEELGIDKSYILCSTIKIDIVSEDKIEEKPKEVKK